MTSKAELAKENEKTREVKEREENVKEGAKDAVKGAKATVNEVTGKLADADIKDIPDKLIPSAERVDNKLASAQDSINDARTAQVGEKNLANYPKIQQVMKDQSNIIGDARTLLQKKNEDGTLDDLKDTMHNLAGAASISKDQTLVTLDKLWTNWAALLTVVAGSGAGSWKQILQESGSILNQLSNTQDFMKLIQDVQTAAFNIASRASTKAPVGQQLEQLNQQWDQHRDQLIADWKKCWDVLSQSPVWQQLVAKGKALKTKTEDVGADTKKEVQDSAQKVADSEEAKKLKGDFKNILQLIIGKEGPSVDPFLDYCSLAYEDLIENQDFSKLADEMSELFESMGKEQNKSQADYERQFDQMHAHTKDLLDNISNNQNLRLALRESRKLTRAAKKDPATKKLLADASKLIKDVTDKKGLNVLDPQLLNEIRAVIVPIMVDHFDNTPLPDYHGYSSNALGKYDYTLSEIRLGATGLVPSKVKVEFRYKAEANPSALKMQNQRMLMFIEASDIQVAFKDVKWTYNRNTIPRFTDSGTVDLATAGKGITLRLKAELHDYQAPTHASNITELLSEPKERKMFTVMKAECDIDDFHVRVSDTGASNVFYEMLAGIWGTKIKNQIENQVETKMNLLCNKFDKQVYDIVRRATQPSLAQETSEALLSVGQSAGAKISDAASDVKASLQK